MPSFTPPTEQQSPWDGPLLSRYTLPTGISVVWNGVTFVQRPYPWLGEIAELEEGVTFFLGGRTYEVSTFTGDALTDAGFELD